MAFHHYSQGLAFDVNSAIYYTRILAPDDTDVGWDFGIWDTDLWDAVTAI